MKSEKMQRARNAHMHDATFQWSKQINRYFFIFKSLSAYIEVSSLQHFTSDFSVSQFSQDIANLVVELWIKQRASQL
jgi:hypothetical protein